MINLANVPKVDLYWVKEQIEDDVWKATRKLHRLVDQRKKAELMDSIIEMVNDIKSLEHEMEIYGM